MTYRKLRIAWSVAWGITGVLLCVLWVRSYWWAEISNPVMTARLPRAMLDGKLIYTEVQTRPNRYEPDPIVTSYLPGFIVFSYNGFTVSGFATAIPPWALMPPVAFAVALPWLHWHFSLRTLLIATTLIAVVLGLIVWLR